MRTYWFWTAIVYDLYYIFIFECFSVCLVFRDLSISHPVCAVNSRLNARWRHGRYPSVLDAQMGEPLYGDPVEGRRNAGIFFVRRRTWRNYFARCLQRVQSCGGPVSLLFKKITEFLVNFLVAFRVVVFQYWYFVDIDLISLRVVFEEEEYHLHMQ